MALTPANPETIKALLPYCVAGAETDPNSENILMNLKDAREYSRGIILPDAKRATQPNWGFATACAADLASRVRFSRDKDLCQ